MRTYVIATCMGMSFAAGDLVAMQQHKVENAQKASYSQVVVASTAHNSSDTVSKGRILQVSKNVRHARMNRAHTEPLKQPIIDVQTVSIVLTPRTRDAVKRTNKRMVTSMIKNDTSEIVSRARGRIAFLEASKNMHHARADLINVTFLTHQISKLQETIVSRGHKRAIILAKQVEAAASKAFKENSFLTNSMEDLGFDLLSGQAAPAQEDAPMAIIITEPEITHTLQSETAGNVNNNNVDNNPAAAPAPFSLFSPSTWF